MTMHTSGSEAAKFVSGREDLKKIYFVEEETLFGLWMPDVNNPYWKDLTIIWGKKVDIKVKYAGRTLNFNGYRIKRDQLEIVLKELFNNIYKGKPPQFLSYKLKLVDSVTENSI